MINNIVLTHKEKMKWQNITQNKHTQDIQSDGYLLIEKVMVQDNTTEK